MSALAERTEPVDAVLSNITYCTLMIVNLSLLCVSDQQGVGCLLGLGLTRQVTWGSSQGVWTSVPTQAPWRIHCQQFQDWLLSSLAFQGTLFSVSGGLLQSQAWGPVLFQACNGRASCSHGSDLSDLNFRPCLLPSAENILCL